MRGMQRGLQHISEMGGTFVNGGGVVTPVLRDDNVRHAENVELEADIRQAKLRKKQDNSLTGGDQAVGEEDLQGEIGNDDIERFRQEYEQKYGKAEFVWDYSQVLHTGVACSLIGALACLLYFQESQNSSYFQWAMFGVCVGGLSGICVMTAWQTYLMYKAESQDPFKVALEQRRAALRRKEQEVVERHDEFVYYDAAREHSRLYQLCCCPSYGKITSKRIIYSAPNPIDLGIPCIPDAVTGCWFKKIETMDYRLIDDVGVEQSCMDFISGAGTVKVHCHGSSDPSIIAEERKRLVEALQKRDLVALKQAERICRLLDSKAGLEEELQETKRMIAEIEEEEQAACKAAGKEWHPTYVLDIDENTAQMIRVPNVTTPFAVMDDLSYRIATHSTDFD